MMIGPGPGGCSTTPNSVTAVLGSIAAGGSHVVTYSAKVIAVPDGTAVSTSGVVTFSPANMFAYTYGKLMTA